MAEYTQFINDEQWKKLKPLLPQARPNPKGGRSVRLIADRAYDSDPLRKKLKTYKIDLIVPHRKNRKKTKT